MSVRSDLGERQVTAGVFSLDDDPAGERALHASRTAQQAAWQRAVDRLADRLLKDMWATNASLDIGIWGPAMAQREAAGLMQDMLDRGLIYLDIAPAQGERGGFRRLLRSLLPGRGGTGSGRAPEEHGDRRTRAA
ncbi:MAG: hypothetical protein ACRDJE_25705 [Dehalococcoidia bacterium]